MMQHTWAAYDQMIDFVVVSAFQELTLVIFSWGLVRKLGEEKVNPLSVPASYGWRSRVTSCFHWLPSQRLMLSTPTNQSGLGIIFTISDNC